MKRIAMIIHSLGIGGMERVMHQLVVNFSDRQNVQVDLILIGKKREILYPLPESVSVYRPSFAFNNTRRAFDTIRTIKFIRKTVNKIDPDTILSFGEYWNNLVLLALYGLNYPVFISDRSKPEKDLGRVQNFLRDLLYPNAAGYIAQTSTAKDVCFAKGWNDSVRVIGNPIRKIQSNGQIEKENVVLTVGRLIKTKHIDQLIRMFADLEKPDWKLVVVGGDAKKMNLLQDLLHLISELGVEQSVILEGEQREIDKYYSKSKIFAFTSSSEGFPNVIGEAMSAGLPVVSYNCKAGPSDMIKDGYNGYLVPLFDQEMFKRRLSELMGNCALRERFGENAKRDIHFFDANRISNLFFNFVTSTDKSFTREEMLGLEYENSH